MFEPTARNIRDLRLVLGLTQEQFAHQLGVRLGSVNRWENGHAKPSRLARRGLQQLADKVFEQRKRPV